MKLITAPNPAPKLSFGQNFFHRSLFLAGSIEQGTARDWQQKVIDRISDTEDLLVFNPRRTEWDATWDQSPSNPKLVEQIQWELNNICHADFVFFFFQAGTKSPISLLELGMTLGAGDSYMVIVCEPGFYREANVIETCKFFNQHVYQDLDTGISKLRWFLGHYI